LHQSVADYDRDRQPVATGRRMWIDSPYAGAKALLVQRAEAAATLGGA